MSIPLIPILLRSPLAAVTSYMMEIIQPNRRGSPQGPAPDRRSSRHSLPQLAQLAASCIWCPALATKFIGSREESNRMIQFPSHLAMVPIFLTLYMLNSVINFEIRLWDGSRDPLLWQDEADMDKRCQLYLTHLQVYLHPVILAPGLLGKYLFLQTFFVA